MENKETPSTGDLVSIGYGLFLVTRRDYSTFTVDLTCVYSNNKKNNRSRFVAGKRYTFVPVSLCTMVSKANAV